MRGIISTSMLSTEENAATFRKNLYAGATRPYLISICGYTVFTNNLGYYTAATSTTFVDLNFDCGYTGGYRVVTEIDWS